MFHITHHIQKRDLLLGCWTKVVKYHNPLWTRTVILKKELLYLPEILMTSLYMYPPVSAVRVLICIGLAIMVRMIRDFLLLVHGLSSKKFGFREFVKKDQGSFLIDQWTFTKYNFNKIAAIPCCLVLDIYKATENCLNITTPALCTLKSDIFSTRMNCIRKRDLLKLCLTKMKHSSNYLWGHSTTTKYKLFFLSINKFTVSHNPLWTKTVEEEYQSLLPHVLNIFRILSKNKKIYGVFQHGLFEKKYGLFYVKYTSVLYKPTLLFAIPFAIICGIEYLIITLYKMLKINKLISLSYFYE